MLVEQAREKRGFSSDYRVVGYFKGKQRFTAITIISSIIFNPAFTSDCRGLSEARKIVEMTVHRKERRMRRITSFLDNTSASSLTRNHCLFFTRYLHLLSIMRAIVVIIQNPSSSADFFFFFGVHQPGHRPHHHFATTVDYPSCIVSRKSNRQLTKMCVIPRAL
jgi:hypothetical protein